ncbi:MAG: sigma-70 family RNA polymerase sigma factor [Magnetospirillum gryphiswaldense]|nr:sigma-70 family RNA polymerase sigma factor [Magnetospirillum gryphiswaldense]
MSSGPDKAKLDLFLAHRSALIDYARPILGCRAQAEDVVQEAYLRFGGIGAHRSLDEPVGFLFRIVRNLALDLARRLGREGRVISAVDCQDVAEDVPSPEAQALYRDQLQVVMAALDELPERTRQAVRLHRLEGLTLAQIAQRLGISVGLAHSLVCDGIAHCQQRLRSRS